MKNQRMLFVAGGILIALVLLLVTMNRQNQPPVVQHLTQQGIRTLIQPADLTGWKTYTNQAYGFRFRYPSNFKISIHEGSSNFEQRFVSVDIGSDEYIKKLQASGESAGSGGVPLFLRIGADVQKENAPVSAGLMKPGMCEGDYHLAEKIMIQGIVISKCEGLTLGSFPSMFAMFKKSEQEPINYTFDSMSYEGSDKEVIEQILSTFEIVPTLSK